MTATLSILFLLVAFILCVLHVCGVGDSRLVGIAVAIIAAVLIADSIPFSG
jgi:hypothetical protein